MRTCFEPVFRWGRAAPSQLPARAACRTSGVVSSVKPTAMDAADARMHSAGDMISSLPLVAQYLRGGRARHRDISGRPRRPRRSTSTLHEPTM